MDGILLVDKAKDWTSHDVCAFIRRCLRIKKVGHAGTLDPQATGLLVLLLGKATKLQDRITAADKTYEGIMQLGVQTDSHDMTGNVVEERSAEGISLEKVREAAESFCGEILQTPPMVSAVKHQGVRLYKLARKGVSVERKARPVTIFNLEIEKKEGHQVHLSAHVSKGTYIRTLMNDLGEALGCLGSLAELRRTQSGNFRIEDAIGIETLKTMPAEEIEKRVICLDELLNHENLQKN